MSRYLDPKNDVIFKAVFACHPDLLISFLNGLLPLPPGREIIDIEYLPFEQVPDTPLKKDSIVDVKCRDNYGRIFIVEMQLYWHSSFDRRITFNASKAYVRQLNKGEGYDDLKPVYSLAILNDVYDDKTDEFYHRYQIANLQNPDEIIKSMEFILVELPKFVPEKMAHKRMAVLWIRFLKEVSENTFRVSEELVADPYITKAVELCERAAFTEGQLNAYESYWDSISWERTKINNFEKGLAKATQKAMAKGLAEGIEKGIEKGIKKGIKKGIAEGMEKGIKKGMEKGIEKGIEQGMEKGREAERMEIAQNLLSAGISPEQVSALSNLALDQVLKLKRE